MGILQMSLAGKPFPFFPLFCNKYIHKLTCLPVHYLNTAVPVFTSSLLPNMAASP